MFTVLLYCVLLHTALGQYGLVPLPFGTPHIKNSVLCRQWKCVNQNLGFPESLPPKDQFEAALKSLVPQGPWQEVVPQVAEKCYGDRPRRYTGSCPGQELMHCAVDQMIEFCPEDSLRKDEKCSPLVSIAGFKYMFSQSQYENKDTVSHKEERPDWFIKNYFSSKCCNLPVLFSTTVMESCGFISMLKSHERPGSTGPDTIYGSLRDTIDKSLIVEGPVIVYDLNNKNVPPRVVNVDKKLIVDNGVKVVNLNDDVANKAEDLDPLECCSLSGFIQPSWISDCGFQLTWNERYRLTIQNETDPVATTTVAPSTTAKPKLNDVKIVPHTCDKETCVFRKLNIISESGTLDLEAFSRLLDNVTTTHPAWTKAKARVVTKCLSKPIRDYIDDCEINKVLACTFDILSENCPHAQKNDACKHTTALKKPMTCQISSSKMRPKNRRQFCGLPNIVSHNILSECGLNSLSRMEFVPDPVTSRPKTHWWNKSKMICEASTESTKCLLGKMGVLNKYGFLDYFKMKDSIRKFTSTESEWSALTDVYLSTFTSSPMYSQQCSSPKKLLNVVDAMLRTCPISKRQINLKCNRILTDMATTAPAVKQPRNEFMLSQGLSHHISFPPIYRNTRMFPQNPVIIRKTPTYDFGILNSNGAPKVEIIDVKTTTYKPLELLPVYMRMQHTGTGIRGTGTVLVRSDGVRVTALHPPMPVQPDMAN